MTKCCKTCHHVNLKSNTAMAAQGYALCNLGPIWEFHAAQFVCNRWKRREKAKVTR